MVSRIETHQQKVGYALIAVVLLAGCTTPQQYMAGLHQRCAAYGIQPNSPTMSQCMMMLDQQNRASNEAANAAMFGAGAAILMQNNAPRPTLPTPVQTNCFSDRFGNTRCTTY
jgi:hypothetical protein